MAKAKCAEKVCVPLELGLYWATHRKSGGRYLVELSMTPRRHHLRLHLCGQLRGYETTEFTDYRGPIVEENPPVAKPAKK